MTSEKQELQPDFSFDMSNFKNVREFYENVNVTNDKGERIDWRKLDPRDYLFDNDEDYDVDNSEDDDLYELIVNAVYDLDDNDETQE